MLSAKYKIKRLIWLVIHGCILQNKISTSETTFMFERVWLARYMLHTEKSENALAIFYMAPILFNLIIVYSC